VEYLRQSIAFVAPATLSSGESASFLPQLRRAIIERRAIGFGYHTRYSLDGGEARNTREADPYALLHYGYAWYLIGYCHLRQEIRNFRLDRMSGLRLLDRTFGRPSNFKLEEPVDDQRNLKVVALFSPEAAPWVRESRSYYVDSMEEVDGGLLVTMRVRVENEIFQWLFGWGAQVRVLEPESLRRRLMTEAGKILENYSG
jgi:predicted DNA-binding transcriptional regulator YafY